MPAPRPARLALLLAATLALAACGDGGDDGAATSAPVLTPISTADAATTAPPATTAAPATSAAAPATSAEAPAATGPLPVGAPLELVQPEMSPDAGPVGASAIACEGVEHLDHHWHTSLSIILDGAVRVLPAEIGIRLDASPPCLYWIHTHVNRGIIHVEAPVPKEYTLADFFAVWGAALGPDRLLDHEGPVVAYVDGARFTADPGTIVLRDGQAIVLADRELAPVELPEPDFSEVG